jgi:hypothetical protein
MRSDRTGPQANPGASSKPRRHSKAGNSLTRGQARKLAAGMCWRCGTEFGATTMAVLGRCTELARYAGTGGAA